MGRQSRRKRARHRQPPPKGTRVFVNGVVCFIDSAPLAGTWSSGYRGARVARHTADRFVLAPSWASYVFGSLLITFGGPVGFSSIGPVCKVRGEIDTSVLVGYCNKAHDGYLGHALLGRWVNLGALTTNSDLKNNYSSVRLRLGTDEIDSGLIKVGAFLGDHVKTGIGTLLNTGAVVGAGSNLFGGRMPPKYVPPFSWGEGDQLEEYRVDKFLATAEIAMRRRGVELSEGMRHVLTGAAERAQAQRDPETRAR